MSDFAMGLFIFAGLLGLTLRTVLSKADSMLGEEGKKKIARGIFSKLFG